MLKVRYRTKGRFARHRKRNQRRLVLSGGSMASRPPERVVSPLREPPRSEHRPPQAPHKEGMTRRIDRYLRVVTWARHRYAEPDGSLVLSYHGQLGHGGIPSPYTRAERLAFARYLA